MRKTYHYTYTPENGLTRTPTVTANLGEIQRMLNIAATRGLPPSDPLVQDWIDAYVARDPNQDLVHQWAEGNDFVQVPMEAQYPWLAYYRGVDIELPVDDPSVRVAAAQAEVDAFNRRMFKAKRHKQVQALTVTVVDKTYDADEESQTRMARAISIAHAQLLEQLQNYLAMNLGNSTITAHELLIGLHDTLAQTKAELSTLWMLADNTQAEVTPDELTQACYQGMLDMSELWGFTEEGGT